MMAESLEDTRSKQLAQLKEAESAARDWQASVLNRLGWTAEHLLQKDVDLDTCPLDSGHCIPSASRDRHIVRCRLHKDGYTVQEVEAANVASSAIYGSSSSVGTIHIDEETLQNILESSLDTAMSGKTWDQRSMPLTMDRVVTDLSQSERLAIYNYCIVKAREMDKPVTIPEEDLMLIQDKKEGNEKKKMSVLERRALERDMKRRRQSYRAKNVHTTKKSYTEILNEVITRQMDLLEQMYEEEQEEEDRQTRRQRQETEDGRTRRQRPETEDGRTRRQRPETEDGRTRRQRPETEDGRSRHQRPETEDARTRRQRPETEDHQARDYRQDHEEEISRPKFRRHQHERSPSRERSSQDGSDALTGQSEAAARGRRHLAETEGMQTDSDSRSSTARDEDTAEKGDRHRHKKHKKHKHKKHHKKKISPSQSP